MSCELNGAENKPNNKTKARGKTHMPMIIMSQFDQVVQIVPDDPQPVHRVFTAKKRETE